MKYSVVVPVYNEEGNVKALAEEIKLAMKNLTPHEIIFVDDGSKDNTVKILKAIKDITTVELRKNFGQSLALAAGFDNAKGEIIITMDGDGQNDPKDIPKLLKKLDQGYDAVSGWRKYRKDPLSKKVASRLQNFMRHFVINDHLHDAGCSLKAYRRECLDELEMYGEFHRYIAELIGIKGFKVGETVVNHRPRTAGKTKYGNVKRAIKGNLDLFLVWFWQKYAGRPLHMFGAAGFVSILIGFLCGAYITYLKIFTNIDISEHFLSVFTIFFIIIGFQSIVTGLMIDLLLRNHNQDKKRYTIRQIHKH